MSIDAKHAYRFGFLKSEKWKGNRKMLVATAGAECACCGVIDWSNDVHHVRYRSGWKHTGYRDVAVLCRDCHDHVHKLFGNKMPTKKGNLFRKSLRACFVYYGPDFSVRQFKEQMLMARRIKWAIVTAKKEIRQFLLTNPHNRS